MGIFEKKGGTIFRDIRYIGGEESQQAVALVLNGKMGTHGVGVDQVSNRILVVEIEGRPTTFVMVLVFMPTSNHREEEVDEVYELLEEIIREIPDKKNLVEMEDNKPQSGREGGIRNRRYWIRNAKQPG